MTNIKDESPFVWVLTKQYHILKIGTNGKTESISPSISAEHISFNIDNTLWLAPKIEGSFYDMILYSDNEGQNWVQVKLPNIEISKLSSTHLGSCFILTPQGSILLVEKSGYMRIIFNEGTAIDMAVSPEGYIWLISNQKKAGGGHLVYWCTMSNFVLQTVFGEPVAKRISVGPEGSARIVTIGGEIASLYIGRAGGLETPGGELFSFNISSSCKSSTIWTISEEKLNNKKHNILKFWDPDSDPYMHWHSLTKVDPLKIVGGY